MLKIKNLSVTKSKGKITILKDLTLSIAKGKITVLLGRSGSGKTTLLRCIAQLEQKYQGQITFCEKELRTLPSKNRSQILGFVPQNYALFPHLTALQNCTQPLSLTVPKKEALDKALKTLQELEMAPYAHSYPQELSGGQQQRVAIARSLLLSPEFLLLDEPTSALDPENTNRLIQILQRLAMEGKGLLISTQDISFATKILERAYFFEDGSILESYDKEISPLTNNKLSCFLSDLCPRKKEPASSS